MHMSMQHSHFIHRVFLKGLGLSMVFGCSDAAGGSLGWGRRGARVRKRQAQDTHSIVLP